MSDHHDLGDLPKDRHARRVPGYVLTWFPNDEADLGKLVEVRSHRNLREGQQLGKIAHTGAVAPTLFEVDHGLQYGVVRPVKRREAFEGRHVAKDTPVHQPRRAARCCRGWRPRPYKLGRESVDGWGALRSGAAELQTEATPSHKKTQQKGVLPPGGRRNLTRAIARPKG